MDKPEDISEFLNQQEFWVNKNGWILINDMDREFRTKAAAILLRRARFFLLYELDENAEEVADYVQEFFGRVAAPAKFMRETKLFQRLIQGGADPEMRWRDDD